MESNKTLILSLCLLFPVLLQGQNWFQEQDVWHYQVTGFVAFTGYQRIQYDRDTSLLGQQAKVIRIEEEVIDQLDPDLIPKLLERSVIVRESGDTVAIWLEDQFYPIYNFSLEQGDQFSVPMLDILGDLCNDTYVLEIEIKEVGEMEISGQMLRFQKWRVNTPFFGVPPELIVVEGIGPISHRFPETNTGTIGRNAYIFYPLSSNLICSTDGAEFDFRCFSNETITYKLGDIPCDLIVLDTEDQFSPDVFQLYPNPTAGELNINLSATSVIQRVRILAVDGKVHKQYTYPQETKFDISDLPKGLYLIQVHLQDQRQAFGRILKQ